MNEYYIYITHDKKQSWTQQTTKSCQVIHKNLKNDVITWLLAYYVIGKWISRFEIQRLR